MNRNHILPNSAFFNSCGATSGFTSCCCSACDFTLFGRWIGSGFRSKKKRQEIAANNFNNFGKENSGSQNVCTVAPTPPPPAPTLVLAPNYTVVCNKSNTQTTIPPTTTDANTLYEGAGRTNNIICKYTTKYCLGQIPSICSIIGNTTTTTVADKTVTTTNGTNWLAWGLGSVAAIGVGIFVYKKFVKGNNGASK